jgi:D-alanyl-D-alanine carboxypeptidase/D-alanyl-D-alanine-endopeptidase (penicillin-binding protein 4)
MAVKLLKRPGLAVALLGALLSHGVDFPVYADRPGVAESAAAVDALRGGATLVQAVTALQAWVKQGHGKLGLVVVDVQSGRVLASHNARAAFNPASNAKLLTAAVALKRLGPDFRYSTELHGRLVDGAVTDLVLRGHGDPSLTVAQLAAMCRSLVQMGLRRVDGKILVDHSRFDSQYVPPAFGQQPDEWAAFRAPVSAVALERNAVTLNVIASSAGEPARIWFHPPGFVRVSGQVATRPAGSGQAVRLSLRPDGSRLHATVGGHLAAGLPRLRFERRVDDPRLLPGYVLKSLLQSMGVQVRGQVASGGERVRARLVWHLSPPLSALLGELGKQSDNFYAEMILKTLGAEATGGPARSRDGARVVSEWLRQVGAADAETVVANGSGLYDANRASPWTLARALRAAYLDPAIRPEFVAQLAVGGVDGTLRSRFRRHGRTRRVRAKTGTLANLDALSGYVLRESGGALAFSIIVSGIGNHRQARQRIDRVVEQMIALAPQQ